MIQSSDFGKIKFEIQNKFKNVIGKLKNSKDIMNNIISMGAIRYSSPIRLVPTYILPAKERRLLGKFQPDSFKTERLVCVGTDGQMDMA